MKQEFNLAYCMDVYKKWANLIVFALSISMCITMVISLRKPATYVSKITILTETGSPRDALGKFLGLTNFTMTASANNMIISILKSRRMREAINSRFNLKERPEVWWKVDVFNVTGGLSVEVRGPDPEFTQKIADFAIQNIDDVNRYLNITPTKPMVRVLDTADYGILESKDVVRKTLISMIFSFLLLSGFIFLSDHIKRQRLS